MERADLFSFVSRMAVITPPSTHPETSVDLMGVKKLYMVSEAY